MRASDSMTRRVITAPRDLPLASAHLWMVREDIRHLPVTEGGQLVGIVSDRDLLYFARRTESGPVFGDETVAAAMTPAPFVCHPDSHVAEIVRLMVERKIDAVPVVNADDELVGLVTSTDLMLLLIEYDEARPLPFTFEVEEAGVLRA